MPRVSIALFATTMLVAIPAVAQLAMPGAPDPARVTAGTYQVDPNHTQVIWTVDHLGISPLTGAFGANSGSLQIDPAKPAEAKVTVTFAVADISTTSPNFTKHLLSADFFEAAKHPTAAFTSTKVEPSGTSAKVHGNLTIKGITKPVTLDAKFFGAGPDPRKKTLNVGFSATASVKRSDFGLGMGVPMVSDQVELRIAGAFEKVG